jgi:hypothetical protein
MILNVNISCSSWGIIGGFELFKASMKLRLINAAICDLGVKLGVLFCHASLFMETTQRDFLFSFSITKHRKKIND